MTIFFCCNLGWDRASESFVIAERFELWIVLVFQKIWVFWRLNAVSARCFLQYTRKNYYFPINRWYSETIKRRKFYLSLFIKIMFLILRLCCTKLTIKDLKALQDRLRTVLYSVLVVLIVCSIQICKLKAELWTARARYQKGLYFCQITLKSRFSKGFWGKKTSPR